MAYERSNSSHEAEDLNEPSTPRYHYAMLPSYEHIRLLILEPGLDEDPLVASMTTRDLADRKATPYEAISYVWGSSETNQIIMVDDKRLPITTSLQEALIQTRLPDRPRTLWADAICINQADTIEKGHQVFAMGRIYSVSKCTLVCFGMELGDCARDAAALVRDVGEMLATVEQNPEFPGAWPWPNADDPLVTDRRWDAWEVLVGQRWFSRGWVVQESALGPDCRVLWAAETISWVTLHQVNCWLRCRVLSVRRAIFGRQETAVLPLLHNHIAYQRQSEADLRVFYNGALRGETAPPAMTTLRLLDEARALDLNDPRDRIYAFMALETEDGIMATLRFQPDYNQSYQDVYWDFSLKYLREASDLRLLKYVKYTEDSDLPSWVPRWNLKSGQFLRASPSTRIKPGHQHFRITENESVLQARGKVIDCVEYTVRDMLIGFLGQEVRAVASVLALWKEVAWHVMTTGFGSDRLSSEFLDTICCNGFSGDRVEWWQSRRMFAILLDSILRQCQRSENQQPHAEDQHQNSGHLCIGDQYRGLHRVATSAIQWSMNRTFAIMGRGYFGNAPAGTCQGDLVAIIYGASTPLILREVHGKHNYYKVIGPVAMSSKSLDPEGLSYNLGWDLEQEDWNEWNLQEQDLNLC